jgi:hypothetical protein
MRICSLARILAYIAQIVKYHKLRRGFFSTLLGAIPFTSYVHFSETSAMDDLTLQEISGLPERRIKDFTCVAFELELDKSDYALASSERFNSALLQDLLARGDKILDVLRLYLFKPGQDNSIGRVGAIANGVYGLWLGTIDGESVKFIARRVSRYQLVQDPIDVSLAEVRRIYNDDTFKELYSAACMGTQRYPVLDGVFDGLRAFRESRELQSWEARFRHLGALAEGLAKKDKSERLFGKELRDRMAHVASRGWYTELSGNSSSDILPKPTHSASLKHLEWNTKDDVLKVVEDLWDNVRNPLTHSAATFTSLGRDPKQDVLNIERIVVAMIHALVNAWRLELFHDDKSAYDLLLE